MQPQTINSVLNDSAKDFNQVYSTVNYNDNDNEDPTNFNDSCYYTESEYLNCLISRKISDAKTLKIISLNIANLLSKLNNLKIFLNNISNESNKPSIIAISETHLNPNQNHGYTEKELSDIIPGYKFFHSDRKRKKGGGVGIFVEAGLASTANVEMQSPFKEEVFESITIRIPGISFQSSTKDLILLSAYRPPGDQNLTEFLQQIKNWIQKYDKKNNEVIVTGDMNIDLLKYQSHPATAEYLDIMLSRAMLPTITRPTRIQHSSATLIDHIFCKAANSRSGIIATEIAGAHGFTDHFPVFCHIEINNAMQRPTKRIVRKYFTTEGHEKRKEGIKTENWDSFFLEENPNAAYKILLDKYSAHYHGSMTMNEYEAKWNKYRREPWMTDDILRKMRKRDRLVKTQ